MNIIEQLGGYERARNIANCKSGVVHPTKRLLDALLQYRRENNIFEVGDDVVKAKRIQDGRIFTIKNITDSGNYIETVCGLFIDLPKIRHATPEEIKAGHRL